jgi:hypothetical protein
MKGGIMEYSINSIPVAILLYAFAYMLIAVGFERIVTGVIKLKKYKVEYGPWEDVEEDRQVFERKMDSFKAGYKGE